MIAYTSGTTGRPKGAVHVHGGFLVKMASETAYQTDLHPDEVLYWVTDMGWIMGPWEMVGRRLRRRDGRAVRGRARLARARPRVGLGRAAPGERAGRLADADPRAQDRRATSIRRKHDLSSLRVFGSTGEPWNPEPYRWLSTWWGRGACRSSTSPAGPRSEPASSLPIRSRRSRSARSAAPRTAWTSTSSTTQGNPVRGKVGELVCKRPWPGMTRGIWGDPDRYIETYWSMYEGVWRHGDWALIDEDGDWYPARALRRHDQRGRQAARPGRGRVGAGVAPGGGGVGRRGRARRDQGRGDLVLLRAHRRRRRRTPPTELRELVASELGRPFKPSRVVFVRGAAEDALGEDPAARGARRGGRRGPRRHVLGREPAGARADPGGARLAGPALGGLGLARAPSPRRSAARVPRRDRRRGASASGSIRSGVSVCGGTRAGGRARRGSRS